MSATHRPGAWPTVSRLSNPVLLLASVTSGLVGLSGIVAYPLIILAVSNFVICLFIMVLGVWFGSSAPVEPKLALALGNAAVLGGVVCLLVAFWSASEAWFVEPLFRTAAALMLAGYSLLAGRLIRQVVRRLKGGG
jgi:hypothetical protein